MMVLYLISLVYAAAAAGGNSSPPGAGHVTTVNRAAPKAQPAPGKTPLALLASVGGAPQAGKRAPLARARAQHATAIKHAQLVHLHNRTRAELARRHRGANATNATAAANATAPAPDAVAAAIAKEYLDRLRTRAEVLESVDARLEALEKKLAWVDDAKNRSVLSADEHAAQRAALLAGLAALEA